MRVEEKSWSEFWAAYWRIEHRHQIPGIFEWDRQLVDFVEQTCQLVPGARLLDLGCGGGDQAKLFAHKGYAVVGIDIAPALIEFANRQFAKENLCGTFIVGDMRAIDYVAEFDACLILSGTFGFFGDVEDWKLLGAIACALKPRGKVFVMFVPPSRVGKRAKTWSETKDGWQLTETWFDVDKSSYRSRAFIIRNDGVIVRPALESGYHADETIRCYTIPELRTMIIQAGLHYLASYSSDDLSVPPKPLPDDAIRNIVVAERVD